MNTAWEEVYAEEYIIQSTVYITDKRVNSEYSGLRKRKKIMRYGEIVQKNTTGWGVNRKNMVYIVLYNAFYTKW